MPHAPRNLLCVSVLVLICDKRSETLRWVARGPLAVHRGALLVWLTGARSMKPTRSAPRSMSIYVHSRSCLFDVALMALSFIQVIKDQSCNLRGLKVAWPDAAGYAR